MENKECWRLKNLIKDVEGTIALSLNEMHRRKVNFMRLSRKEKVCQHYADGLHKFWWKKLRRPSRTLNKSFNKWVERTKEIPPEWLSKGRKVQLPKPGDLRNEK